MTSLLGIDLGTSSVKVVVYALDGTIRGIGSSEYPILTPSVGYAEQDPADWWRATVSAVRQAMEKAGRPEISGIGFSGQMHGFVLISADKAPLQPAIIWADQRSADLLEEIQGLVGSDLQKCGTAPAAGFLISSLFWLQKHQPESLDRALTFLMPKDYVRFKITGELETDDSDASATGIFDVERRIWADEVIARLKLPSVDFSKDEKVGRAGWPRDKGRREGTRTCSWHPGIGRKFRSTCPGRRKRFDRSAARFGHRWYRRTGVCSAD